MRGPARRPDPAAARRPRHLLCVVARGRLDPAGLKRVYDLLPALRRFGYRVHVLSYDWSWLWRMRGRANSGSRLARWLLWSLNATRLTPGIMRLRNTRSRLRFERLVDRVDTVVVNRTPLNQEWRRILATRARRVIYDLDDAIWLHDDDGFAGICGLARTVVVGNEWLADHVRTRHPDVRIIPTGVRLDRYERAQRPRRADTPCIIGWVGSASTAKYLALLVEPLARLGAELPIVLEIVGTAGAPLPLFRNVTLRLHPSVPYDPVRFVPGFDIGMMPLADGEWERGKCGAKALEYMAAGIPSVCSVVGESARIIEDGVTGFLVRTPDEWWSILRRLALDRDLRHRVGRAGQARVRASFSPEVIGALWHDALQRETAETIAVSAESWALRTG